MRLSVLAGLVLVVFALFSVTSVWQAPVETVTSTSIQQAAQTTAPTTTIDAVVSTTTPSQTDTDRVIRLPADRYPTHAAFAEDRFWVIAQTHRPLSGERPPSDAFLMGIDAGTGAVEVEVLLGESPSRVVADAQAVWVTHWETGSVSRLDPNTGEIVATIPLELPFDYGGKRDNFLFVPYDVVMGHGSIWVSTARGAVARIDLHSNDLHEIYEFERVPIGADLAVGPDGVWVTGDVGGLYHLSSSTGKLTHMSLESLDHLAASVFVPGGEMGDTVYVTGDRLERSEGGQFRVNDGSHILSGEAAVSAVDAEALEVVGVTEFANYVYLGWVNGFFGALDASGVFTHLAAIPRLGSQINHTSWGGGELFETFRGAWEIDSQLRRLIRVDETGVAAVELPFEIDDSAGARRPVPDELTISDDWVKHDLPRENRLSGDREDHNEWLAMPGSPLTPLAAAGVAIGDKLIGVDYEMKAAEFDPTSNTWTELPDIPLRFFECSPGIGVFRGQPVVDHCSGIAIWDEVDFAWTPIPHPDPTADSSPTIIATDDRLFAWGDDFYEFVGNPKQPSRLAVGISVLDLPDGWSVDHVRGEDGWRVEVFLDSPGGSCVVNALHTSAEGTLQSYITGNSVATQITPSVGGDPVDVLVMEQGEIDELHHFVWATGTTDVIDAACDTKSDLEELAPRIWSPHR